MTAFCRVGAITIAGWLLTGAVPAGSVAAGSRMIEADAAFLREVYALKAEQSVRLDRFVAIGEKCRSISDEDAATIRARSREMLEAHAADLPEKERDWARGYLQGLRVGALRVVDFVDSIQADACARFAKPGGALMRIMTWTNKPQRMPDGSVAPARMTP
ncbi:hypothetical protein JQK15_20070 [Sphingobium sp. BHU LFT2]|uniref:hypothetical protein n=1 Tax=Sphingobium sp. BHU LFT2 TaxID=2807634 RepID=UPI001BEB2C71|nr:hypothetical protein [Sphingobium sp. BHU LFT2]MBT2245814.1 hypothetical protein [Sphingobium sp. BHU LFT2]